jgi:hypothetical protein
MMQAHAATRTANRPRWDRAAARGFAFACFFPYPALAIGASNGLQLSQALALAGAPLLCARAPGRPLGALLLIVAPVYLSALANSMLDSVPAAEVLPKESASLTLALLVLWHAEWLMRRDLFREVLAAACAAIVVHMLVGLVQVYSFAHNEFPLLFLYCNPSFKSMEEWHRIYATYIQRPCGLFPEPSAMTASLGAWLVLLAGMQLDTRRARDLGWRGGLVSGVALAGGFLLAALSRSGSTFAIMGGVLAVCFGTMRRGPHSSGVRKLLTRVAVLLAVALVMGYAAVRLSQGFQDRMESSWGLRGISIQTGLTANTDLASLAFGVGPGQSTPIIRRSLAGVPLPEDQDDLAIFSLTVCYYMETGLVGSLALLGVLVMALRAIVRSSAVRLGLGALATWLVGVAATTSYMPLSAIWLFLGAMLCWDRLFPPRSHRAMVLQS